MKISSNEIDKIKQELNLKIYKESNKEAVFINNQNPNELLNKLINYKIDSLLIEEIPLEDLFINYYK